MFVLERGRPKDNLESHLLCLHIFWVRVKHNSQIRAVTIVSSPLNQMFDSSYLNNPKQWEGGPQICPFLINNLKRVGRMIS